MLKIVEFIITTLDKVITLPMAVFPTRDIKSWAKICVVLWMYWSRSIANFICFSGDSTLRRSPLYKNCLPRTGDTDHKVSSLDQPQMWEIEWVKCKCWNHYLYTNNPYFCGYVLMVCLIMYLVYWPWFTFKISVQNILVTSSFLFKCC